jgi:alpha-L-rhamnosidase
MLIRTFAALVGSCLLAIILTSPVAAWPGEAPPVASIVPVHPRCEYLDHPLAVDAARPRLSWELHEVGSGARGLKQTAYRIQVMKVNLGIVSFASMLWDSGWVESSATNQIEFGGEPLPAGQEAVWWVCVRDGEGVESAWSAFGGWTAGLNTKDAWSGAKWIGDPTPAPKEGFDPLPAPMLRTEFDCAGGQGRRIMQATVYVSALGAYQLRLNGERVGNHELAPEWTDYTKRVQYQAYDVKDQIRLGKNCIGAMLGDGWYAGKIGLTGIVPKGPPRAIYGRQPRLLVKLVVRFLDNTETVVVSDGTWQTTLDGPIRAADIMDGETYDAQRELTGWDLPGFDAAAWKPAIVVDAPRAALVAQPNEPIRVNSVRVARAITEPKPGVYVIDMGQNMVGWCRARLRGTPGKPITLRHAEALNPDGTIYTANLRGAAQTDRYTPRSSAEETYEPRFTYHGFRYVEITGLAVKPALDAIIGRVANSSAPEVGTFACSDPMVNRLWQNILWTQRGNLVGVPTDCPQRDERCGWMGDILAFAPTANFNMDMAAFYTKWVPDTRDAQAADGRFADFSPQPYDPNVRFSGVPAWGDAGVFVPWAAYQSYGDTRIFEGQFDAAVRWIEHIRAKNPDLLWKNDRHNDYGDWLNADTLKLEGWPAHGAEVPKDVFATMFFYRSTQIVAEMARVLNKPAEAKTYIALADSIRAAFTTAYLAPDAELKGDTQAGYALALHFGLIPESAQPRATQRMVDRFKPYDGQISTGFHSTLPLMAQLSSRGRNDDAYRLLLNRRMPSWGYEVDHGATTVWERWDGWVEGRAGVGGGGFQDPGMNSLAHYAIGAVGEWMYSSMLGIRPASPGYASVVIQPHPGPGITWAKGTYHSIRGPIAVGWEQSERSLTVRVSIPPNMTANVLLPAIATSNVELDGKPLPISATKVTDAAGPWVQIETGSGAYVFTIRN